MSSQEEVGATEPLRVSLSQQTFPPHDALHGTPHPMVQRRFLFELPAGQAEVEQTDYGHPGRFNPCQPRRLPPALQGRAELLAAAAEALARLLA